MTLGLTEDELAVNFETFISAGFEPIGATITWLIYDLATNPECQTKLIQEIDKHFGKVSKSRWMDQFLVWLILP